MSDFLTHLDGTALVDCWSFWRSRRDGRRIPLKRAIDPTEMPRRIIASLFLYERTVDSRFRCRLSGTEICAAFGYDATGRYLDEMLPPGAQARRLGLFASVLGDERPAIYLGRFVEPGREWVRFRRLLLPVVAGDGGADTIFGMVVTRPDPEAKSRRRNSDEDIDTSAFATDADLA